MKINKDNIIKTLNGIYDRILLKDVEMTESNPAPWILVHPHMWNEKRIGKNTIHMRLSKTYMINLKTGELKRVKLKNINKHFPVNSLMGNIR